MKRSIGTLLASASAAMLVSPALAASEVNLPCMVDAIATRETVVSTAFNTYSGIVAGAYRNRQTALRSAWTIQNEDSRENAIEDAWRSFKSVTKNAKTNLRSARKNAWKDFRDDRRDCNAKSNTDPGGGESADTSL